MSHNYHVRGDYFDTISVLQNHQTRTTMKVEMRHTFEGT